ILFQITGIILICLGIVIKAAYEEYVPLLDDRFLSTPSLLIFSGSVIFFIAFFGCYGALKENQCMVFTFSVLLGAVFIMELTAGITGYILFDETSNILTDTLKKTMNNYGNITETTKLWDSIQNQFHCCGTKNFTEWYNILKKKEDLPVSCCANPVGAIGIMNCTGSSPYLNKSPCIDLLSAEIENNALSIGGTALGIAFFQLLGIVFACRLGRNIRNNSYESV
ncbi:hypothetical protein AAG570_000419, partial [Ranatra chinensis]